jgi:hypothetical protein
MKKIQFCLGTAFFATALAFYYLSWWVLVLGVLALIVIGKLLFKPVLLRLVLKAFRLKGAALNGATAEVHSVTPAVASADKEGTPSDSPQQTCYSVEVTIRPAADKSPFGCWEPGELRLVSPEAVLNPKDPEADDSDDTCEIKSVELEQEGAFKPDEGLKFQGPQRLKLLIAVKPGTAALKFRYYFEQFGSVALLAPPFRAAQAA